MPSPWTKIGSPQEKPHKRGQARPRMAPSDLLRSERGRATLDTIASWLGAPNIFQADRGNVGPKALGTFHPAESGLEALMNLDELGETAVYLSDDPDLYSFEDAVFTAAHEAEHARDFHDRGGLGKLARVALHHGTNILNALMPGVPIQNPIEETAEVGGHALRLVREINQIPEIGAWVGMARPGGEGELEPMGPVQWAAHELQRGLNVRNSAGYGYELNPDDLLRRIQDIARHPDNRGSMIRRALLEAGYELR